MSVIYPSSIIELRLDIVANAIDAAGGHGNMRLLDPASNILSTLALARPAASVSGNLLTFNGMSLIDPAAAASGIATAARIEDSVGDIVISGITVSTLGSSADLILTPTNTIVAGQTIAITNAQITGH